MAVIIPSVETVTNEAVKLFNETFGEFPTFGACAPGRVNLIGEHVDYNDGFVLPMALPMVTVVVGKPSSNATKCRVVTSANVPKSYEEYDLPLERNFSTSNPKWVNYVKSVFSQFNEECCSFDMAIATSVPIGGGLSSSAALEVAVYTFLEQVNCKEECKDFAKALLCQKAEHNVGIPCGIMDQLISIMAVPGNALLIDCRSLETKNIPLKDESVTILIINSNVKHELTGSEYPARRLMCEEAAKLMNKKSLRDVDLGELESFKSKMSEEMYRRAYHVVTEIKRTLDAVDALKNEDNVLFGKLMIESHISLRDNFNVSCPLVDQLVDIVCNIDGVYGSRMTGGGFGGCTVTFLKTESTDRVIQAVNEQYNGIATFYMGQASGGARSIKLVPNSV